MRRLALLLIVLTLVGSSVAFGTRAMVHAQAAVSPELDALLERLSKVQALTARFHEEKRMALLAVPLTSDGVIYYAKPRLLARHTEKPQKSSLILRGDTLSFGDKGHSESMGIDSQPAVRVLVDTFVSVLSGDRVALDKLANLTVEKRTDKGWRIRVTPRDPKVQRIVRSMVFEGDGAELSRMELVDANGDTTITTFSATQLKKPFTDAETARIFRIGG